MSIQKTILYNMLDNSDQEKLNLSRTIFTPMSKTKVYPCASHWNALQPHTRLKACRLLLPMWTVGLIRWPREEEHDQLSSHIIPCMIEPIFTVTARDCDGWIAMEQRRNQQDANSYGWVYGTQPTPALTYPWAL